MATQPDLSSELQVPNPIESTSTSDPLTKGEAQQAGSNPETAPTVTGAKPVTSPGVKAGRPGKAGVFTRVIGAFREWVVLQKTIRLNSAAATMHGWEIRENLNVYRMILSTVAFKSHKLDNDIWNTDERINTILPDLQRKTHKKALFLRGRKTLRALDHEWKLLVEEQVSLLDTLEKSPKSIEFYNRIHLAQIQKREQEVRESEVARRSAQAKEAIEKALAHIGEADMQLEGPTLGRGILKLDEAKNFWTSRLQEISNLETSSNMDPDEIIHIYSGLQSTIQDAPRMAEQVREVEVQFTRMMSMHEDLASYGKNIIPAEDMARMLMVVQDVIPNLWATGDWDKLRRSLDEVSNFVKFYDLPVRSELSLAERRKPGLTRALLGGAGSLPITQITPLIRTLVSAIDARDKYMVGHSDAVARLAVQVARKMNWSGEDLDYLEIAALLHDVGKIVVPENVLTKLDTLSPDDWKTIQMHPFHGARIVKSIDSLNRIAPWIYHHQERWDGQGYPDRVSSKDIPPAARIIAVGEAYTAMTTDQPKRKALSVDEAIKEMSTGAGSQFDPDSANALIQTIESGDQKTTLIRGQ
ncbi:MAG: HD domain-containing protein [Anaerolineaceae bacterium]|nr:HD domain-containing protein [Anaerolineaceae bacterium]